MNKLSVIIVTFNNQDDIKKCINSVVPQIHSWDEIVIVDNNSKDNTVEIINSIKRNIKNIKIIKNSKNNGFAIAVNQGIKKASKNTTHYLLLNPDCILGKNSIKNLKFNSGICGGLLVNKNTEIQNSFFKIPDILIGAFEFTNLKKIFRNNLFSKKFYYKNQSISLRKATKVDGVSGAYMLIAKSTIKNIGLFDEKFFLYLEDVDFCKRSRDAKINVYFCPNAKSYHFEGGSSKNKKNFIRYHQWINSRDYYFKKNNPYSYLLLKPLFMIDKLLVQCKLHHENRSNKRKVC